MDSKSIRFQIIKLYMYKESQKIVRIVEVKKLCLPLAAAYC